MEKGISIAKKIQRYLMVNIGSGKWHEGTKIPSENQLAKMFSCSRLTARFAIIPFVFNGSLKAIRGKGYYVAPNSENLIFQSTKSSLKADHQKLEKLDHLQIDPKLLKLYKINPQDFRVVFSKEYFDTHNQVMLYQISTLNKKEIFEADLKQIENSLLKFLLTYGVVPTNSYEQILVGKWPFLNKLAKQIGYNDYYPIVIDLLLSDENWVEFSIKLFAPQHFRIYKSIKTIW